MTDTPTPPDGWYPDPAGSGGLRRWNGSAWTDEVRPAPDAPAADRDEPPAPEAPVAPEAPAAAPAAAPVPPVAPPLPSAPAYSGAPVYASAPAYPGATPSAAPPAHRDIPTNTVWIWLVVLLPLVSLLTLFLFDWSSYIQESIYASAFPEEAPYVASSSLAITAGASALSFVLAGLTVLFSFLDWRQLRARGIQKPFHWAWSFFVLVISSGGVYIIGRAVVLRRQTGRGLAPVWAWIAVMVVSIIAFSIWFAVILGQTLTAIEDLQYSFAP